MIRGLKLKIKKVFFYIYLHFFSDFVILPPQEIVIIPTQNCNLDCIFCFQRNLDMSDAKKLGDSLISYKCIERIIKEVAKYGVKNIMVTGGGESLLHNDIEKIFLCIKKSGLKGSLITNGTLLNSLIIDKLISVDWNYVRFSLDASNREVYSKLKNCSMEIFDNVINNIRYFVQKKKENNTHNPKICLNYIILRENHRFIEEFVDLGLLLEVDEINFTFLSPFGNTNLLGSESQLNRSEKIAIVKEIKAIEKEKKSFNTAISINAVEPDSLFCYWPWRSCFINYDYLVYPCCYFRNRAMGDIRKQSFKEIWKGDLYRHFRNTIKLNQLETECLRCRDLVNKDNKAIAHKL